MTGNIKEILNYLLISVFLILFLFPQGVLASDNATPNVEITCNFPGRIVEAGETVKFDLKIKNNFGTYPKMLDVDTFKG
jgi:hypothetical protein